MIFVNNEIKNPKNFSEDIFTGHLCIYEVIRIFNKCPIFLQDNLLRLNNSIKKSNFTIDIATLHIPDKVNHYISLDHISEGNLKYVLCFTNGKFDEYLYQIPHHYPSAADYETGVDTVSLQAIRKNPEVKYLNPELREQTNRIIQEKNIYEVILVDSEGYITEGSRSNVFFLRDHTFYTASTEYVLPGTSRKRVIDLCRKCGYAVKEERIAYKELSFYETAFLTGTSPLILPIKKLDSYFFDISNQEMRTLMKIYFSSLGNND